MDAAPSSMRDRPHADAAPAQESLKILIVDDTQVNLRPLEVLVARLGHTPLAARDGVEALEVYEREAPDLVLMDIMMPRLDGVSAVREIRARWPERWTPIILYSALDGMRDITEGLAAGADDYLVKPASHALIRAKINSHARQWALQRKVRAYADELASWRAEAEEQNRLGAHVMARLTDAAGLRDAMVRHFNLPADTFSGDLLCAARAPGDVLNVMLADATGHGLAAALTAMPLTQVFYSMTEKGFPLSSIAEELNRKLKRLLPADRFVAATLAAVDVRNQTVEVWNGGNPDALFVTYGGDVRARWASSHPPLGILPEALFSAETELVVFHEPGDLLLCSDGLVEAETAEGEWLGLNGVLSLMGDARDGDRLTRLVHGVEASLDGRPRRDDISCMMVSVPIERRELPRLSAPAAVYHGDVAEWRMELSYGAKELRYLDVVPSALGLLTQLEPVKPHQGALFLIVSELFNNALDHGLLGLDSATKSWIGGYEIYMQQRAERLARLTTGKIELVFRLHADEARAALDIQVIDSGPGFDYVALNAAESLADISRPHGRGIALVRNLCHQVVYSGAGNRVWVRYWL